MHPRDAAALIRGALAEPGGTWADIGAGEGTFTRALAMLLGPGGRVHAVDRDPARVRALQRLAQSDAGATITAHVGDLMHALPLPPLDGALLANVLHFVPDGEQAAALARVVDHLRPGGALVLVEYERRGASRWVPFPVPRERFAALAARAGLGAPELVGERASAYGGSLYAAVARRVRRAARAAS